MRKIRYFKKTIRRLLPILAISLILFYIVAGQSSTYARSPEPGSARVDRAEVVGKSGLRIDKRIKQNDRWLRTPQRKPVQKGDLIRSKHDWLTVNASSWAKLLFYQDSDGKTPSKQEATIKGNQYGRGSYKFPCVFKGGVPEIKWGVGLIQGKCVVGIESIKNNRKSFQKSKSLDSEKTYLAQAPDDDFEPEVDSRPVHYYCSAMAEFAVADRLKGRAWSFDISDSLGDIFSQNDPCGKAIRQCERQRPGGRCIIDDEGEFIIGESDLVTSLTCAGTPFDSFIVKASENDKSISYIKEMAKKMENKALGNKALNEKGLGSCSLNIHTVDEIVISPPGSNNIREVAVSIEVTSDRINVHNLLGVVSVQSTNPITQQEDFTLLKRDEYCTYSQVNKEPCKKPEPIPEIIREKILDSKSFKALVGTLIRDIEPPDYRDINGNIVRLGRKLGFFVVLPDEWRILQNQNDLGTVLEHVEQSDPVLADAYVAQSLQLLKQKDAELGTSYEEEISRYLAVDSKQLLAVDFKGLASINADKRVLQKGNSLEQFVENRVNQLRSDANAIISLADYKDRLLIDGLPAWKIQTQINLKGASGSLRSGYQKIPEIGAGRTVYFEGKEGQGVTLVHTSYLVRNKVDGNQSHYFVMNFITTLDRIHDYDFDKIAQSFHALTPES